MHSFIVVWPYQIHVSKQYILVKSDLPYKMRVTIRLKEKDISD